MEFDDTFEKVDRWLKKKVINFPDEEAAKREKIDAEISGHLAGRAYPAVSKPYFDIFGVIDQKASALLTHISVMIAVNAFLLTTPSDAFLDFLSVILLLGFVCTALMVLRLLRFRAAAFPDARRDAGGQWLPVDETVDLEASMRTSFDEESYYRSRLYRLSLNLTTMLTLFSAAVVVLYGISVAFF